MTGPQLATLATLAWLVVTTILFIELANWSAGGSWTIVPGIVRGVRGWVFHGQEMDLAPFALSPRAASPAPLPSASGLPSPSVPALVSAPQPDITLDPGAEVIDLDHSEFAPAPVRSPRR